MGESPTFFLIMANPVIPPHHGSQNSWSDFENSWLYHQMDNWLNDSALYQIAHPGEVQYSEWSQQMTSTMYQNWYNSAPEQMKRAMDAGINPFVAASGISGNSSGSVAPTPAPSNPLSLPNLIGSAAQGLAAVGGAFNNVAGGLSVLRKLRPEIEKINTETRNLFESLGFTKLQSIALSAQLKYLDQKEQIGVWQALANFDKTKQEYFNLVATHNNILAQYDEIIAHKDLLIQEQGEVAAREQVNKAMADKLKYEAAWQKSQNDFFEQHGYVLGSPVYESIRDMMVSNGTFDMATFGDTVAGYNGKISIAVENAKASASWDYRPSNVTEAAAYAGNTIGSSLRDLIFSSQEVTDWSSLASKLATNVAANREFNQAFKDAKEDLFEEYLSKKRYYRNIRRSGNTQEVARAKMAMETAKSNYEELTKENFGNELIKSISPR